MQSKQSLDSQDERIAALAELCPLSISLSHREQRDDYTLELRRRTATHLKMLRANNLGSEAKEIWNDLKEIRDYCVTL